ncbi:MAG TPA: tripartite tricarboxylate transporter substrate-binding protein [Hyphomicrobiaceae bacterium]|nr:tripartite tricarboxylate transporter substrate-binding protein [Hyphomicrobiaceae bacterium]
MFRAMRGALTAAACLTVGAAPAVTRADDVAEFYKGKQINWILSAGEGGGYSSYARAFAPYFSAHIPGKPNIVIQNMPGGGGIRAMNHLYAAAPKDGTTIGLVHSSVPFAPLFGTGGAQFDPREMNWIGSLATASSMCVAWHESGIKSWQDLFDKEFIVGGTGAGSRMETLPKMVNELFGTKIKIISGYKGGNEVFLAMERGEVHGRCGGLVSSINSTRPDWFPKKKVAIPITIAVERNKLFPDVPAIIEFAKDERTKQILELILVPQELDRPILAPPGVPPERVAALRVAFHAAINDPGFIEEAKKSKLEIDEVSGEKVAALIRNAYAVSKEIVAAANQAMDMTKEAK